MKTEFDDFMQDMYDEEELQYMDSGFADALRLAFNQGWIASRQSPVVKLPDEFAMMSTGEVEALLDAAGVKYE
jgi:hypothetical protein